ncbi:MAG: hypothetical protein LBL04_05850 [Bacteroidales bacterium]|jgi:hypothetical protein|nr:hypothetical protein [Bacteroidales bacterium]
MKWKAMEKRGIRKTGILFAGIFLAIGCLVIFPGMTGREKPVVALNAELRTEAMMQYDRLEALRTGKLPMSRFATPELVHRQEALFYKSDRDPADIVVRRTRALWNDLSQNPDAGVWDMEAELKSLEHDAKNTPATAVDSRKELYVRACALRRRIAFANPLLDFDRIVFVKHKKNPRTEIGGDHMAGQYYGIHATGGEGLFILENAFGDNPAAKNVINGNLPDGAYLSPELSFDGRKILFAYTEAQGYRPAVLATEDKNGFYNYSGLQCSFTDKNSWHIYSVDADGSNLQQLTDGVFNDFDPCWLPGGKVAFISDRRGGFGRCHMTANGGAPWFTYTLHRMNVDGSAMERLSHHETCEWQPSVMHDGNIVYSRWDYVDRGFFQAHHPWTTTPDGRNALSIHGNYPKNWKDRTCMEMDIRAIPGSQNLAATAAAHHGQTYGSIVLVNPMVDDDDAMAPVRLVTPDERFPESEYGYYCREASYSTPWPLSEDYYICVFGYPEPEEYERSPSGSDSKKTVENYGIYLLDAFGNIELLYRDPKIACLSPIPLKARHTPPVIPDMVQPYIVDMNQKRLNLDRPEQVAEARPESANHEPAVVSVMNIYESRHDWPEDVKIKSLRIIQVLPKSNPGRNNPAIGYGTEKNARVVLGTVPVEEDGSARFYLRPYIPVFFQALDEKGRAVQSMRSDVYTAPKENLSCIGCHENRRSAPPTQRTTIAMKKRPSVIRPELEGSNPFSYVKLVQPVLDKNCVSCHREGGKEPNLSGKVDDKQWLPSYRNLKPFAFYYDGGGSFVESKTYPGKFGALASKLYRQLEKGHHNVKLSRDEMHRLALWLDCNSDFYGTYEKIEEQRRGETVRPILE